MAVKIKLKRMGKIRNPQYRIIVADSRTKRDGRAIEEIGLYHPKEEPSLIRVDSERVQYWLSVGAQPTDPVRAILTVTGDWQAHTGEAGAEGTLQTKEPAAAKSDVFAKVLAEAHKGGAGEEKPTAKPAKKATTRKKKTDGSSDTAEQKAPAEEPTLAEQKAPAEEPAPAEEAAAAADVDPAGEKA